MCSRGGAPLNESNSSSNSSDWEQVSRKERSALVGFTFLLTPLQIQTVLSKKKKKEQYIARTVRKEHTRVSGGVSGGRNARWTRRRGQHSDEHSGDRTESGRKR